MGRGKEEKGTPWEVVLTFQVGKTRKKRWEAGGALENLSGPTEPSPERIQPENSQDEGMGSGNATLTVRGQEITGQQRLRVVKSESSPSPGA